MQEQYQELIEAHNIARHNVDLALSPPRDYTLEEKRRFTEEYDATAKAIDEAICAEFNALPRSFRRRCCVSSLSRTVSTRASGSASSSKI